ncbi:WD40 repeat domain-containing protein [Streptomyces virginiae]|uniref:WD40 repeat domain-containing protein n=1 Tax=Streptomyces virginiae TaxID=1961 RepID=UPI00343BAF33
MLALDAARFGHRDLAARLMDVDVDGEPGSCWDVQWATGSWVDQRFVCLLEGWVHPRPMATAVVDGRTVAIGEKNDRTARVWDLETGKEVGDPLTGHGPIRAMATAMRDDSPVVVIVSSEPSEEAVNVLRIQDLSSRVHLLEVHMPLANDVETVVVEGRLMAVTAHDDGTLRVWDLAAGEPVGDPLTGHSGEAMRVITTMLDGRPVAISSSCDQTVRVWELTTRQQVDEPFTSDDEDVYFWKVATAEVDDRPVVVTATGDCTGKIQVWDLVDRHLVSEFVTDEMCDEISTAVINGRPVAITADGETVFMVDLATGLVVDEPILGHRYNYTHDSRPIYQTTTAVVNGRPFALTNDEGGRTFVWDLENHVELANPQRGHTADWMVSAIDTTVGQGNQPIAVSIGYNMATVMAWDLETGQRVTEPFHARRSWDVDGAAVNIDDRPVAIVSQNGTVDLWDVVTGRELGRLPASHCPVTTILDGRAVAITGEKSGQISVWDLATQQQTRLIHGTSGARPRAATIVDGRAVVITTSAEGSMAMWDLTTGQQIGAITECNTEIQEITVTVTGDRLVAATVDKSDLVQAWDLHTGNPLGDPFTFHFKDGEEWEPYLFAAVTIDGRPFAVAGSGQQDDLTGTVQIRDLRTGQPAGPDLTFPWMVTAIKAAPEGRVLVSFGREIALLAPCSSTI